MAEDHPSQADKARAFKALHEGTETFVMPNPWDLGSTQMLAASGFKALATTSAGFAFSMGLGDGGITLEQKLEHCEAICRATALPVSADMENGFADDPEGVAKVVRRAISTGLAGCSIEDFSRDGPPTIYDFDHSVERVAAAVETARSVDFPFVITARAEGLLRKLGDMDDVVRRLQAFEQAGADVLYAPGLRDVVDVAAVMNAVSKPVNVLAHAGLTVADLAGLGVRRISLGGALYRASIGGLLRTTDEISGEGRFDDLNNAVSVGKIVRLLQNGSS